MNQSFFEKLKRVRVNDFFQIILLFIAIPFSFYLRKKRPNIWLFSDCKDEARDNAFWLFKYVSTEHTTEDHVFALSPKSLDYPKVKGLGKVIPFGTLEHWVFYLSAKYIISSQKNCGPDAAISYVLERFGLIHGKNIFLQHGIIKDNISFLYHKYTNIRLFVCSTLREYKYVQEIYGYPKEYVKLLGLCRFDCLWNLPAPKKTLVIMPTWRKWLSHPTSRTTYHSLKDEFLHSPFYRSWLNLLNSPRLSKLLDCYNYTVSFYLHREAQKYANYFWATCPRVNICNFPKDDVQDLLIRSHILVTDYSSVAMDFAFMNKPLFYYQFDYSEYRSKHLEEGYFNYLHDGFGPVCENEESLLTALESFFQSQFGEDPIYQKRRDSFFTLKDNHNCERTYNAIKGLI